MDNHNAAAGPPAVEPLAGEVLLGELPRRNGSTLRISVQYPADGPGFIALRLFVRADDGTWRQPLRGRGFSLRTMELEKFLAALLKGWHHLHEEERARRMKLDHEVADLRRQVRGGPGRRDPSANGPMGPLPPAA